MPEMIDRPIIGLSTQPITEPMPISGTGQRYIDAIAGAGGAPLLVPLGLDDGALQSLYALLDGLLLPGGCDVAPEQYGETAIPELGVVEPERDSLELRLARWALRDDLPILGICRGMQLLSVAAGGTLYQDIPTQLPAAHAHSVREFGRAHLAHHAAVTPGTHLHRATGQLTIGVNTFHHQAVRDVPPGFMVSAEAPDGVIEGIEQPALRFVVGVQCHPESLWNTTAPEYAVLFRAFVDAARATRPVSVH